MAISRKVKVQEPRIEKTDPLAQTLLASPLGATGVGRQPLPSRARVGNGWGKSQANSGTEASRVYVYPPTRPPHRRLGGVVGGLPRGAGSVPAQRGSRAFKCGCGRKPGLRSTGHDRRSAPPQALGAGVACDSSKRGKQGRFSRTGENLEMHGDTDAPAGGGPGEHVTHQGYILL